LKTKFFEEIEIQQVIDHKKSNFKTFC